MEEISAFRRQLETHRPADWETLPDFPLYMDQVLSYMERQTIRLDESDALTASMVNNYTKNALVPRAEGKKYNRDHLAYLTFVCILTQVMSVRVPCPVPCRRWALMKELTIWRTPLFISVC